MLWNWELVFLGISHAPTPRGPGPMRSPILGVYAYTPCHRTTKFDVVTHVGRSVYIGVSHASHSKGAKLLLSPIIIRIFLHLCLHPSKCRTTIFGTVTPMGRVMISGQTIPVFAPMRRATAEFLVPRFCWLHYNNHCGISSWNS